MGYDEHVKLIGVGKDSHMSNLSNWTGGNDASVTADIYSAAVRQISAFLPCCI